MPHQITLVGSRVGQAIDGANVTLLLPDGTQDGDVVIVWGGHFNRGSVGPTTAGYESLFRHTAALPYFDVSWKRLGGSPSDGSVVCSGSGNAQDGSAYALYVLRGLDASIGSPASIIEAMATAGPTTSTNPNAPSVVTQTSGTWVLALALSSANDAAITAPSGYSNHVTINSNDTNDATVAGATKVVATAGTEDPASWTVWASGAWITVTIALRPMPESEIMRVSFAQIELPQGQSTASLSASEDADTLAAQGSIAASGRDASLQATEDGDSLVGSGELAVVASLTGTEDDDSLSASSGQGLSASLSASEDGDTLSGDSAVSIDAQSSVLEGGDVLSSSASQGAEILRISWAQIELPEGIITVSLGATEGEDTLAGAAELAITASLSAAEDNDSVSGDGTVAFAGVNASLSQSEVNDTVAGVASLDVSASLNVAEGNDTLSASGAAAVEHSVSAEAFSITIAFESATRAFAVSADGFSIAAEFGAAGLNLGGAWAARITEGNDTVSASAAVSVSAESSAVEDADVVSASAEITITASASTVEDSDRLSSVGGVPPVDASLSATEGDDTVTASAIHSTGGVVDVTEADDVSSASVSISIVASADVTEGGDVLIGSARRGRFPASVTPGSRGRGPRGSSSGGGPSTSSRGGSITTSEFP